MDISFPASLWNLRHLFVLYVLRVYYDSKLLSRHSLCFRHVGCICPAGYEGSHCEIPVKGFSVTAMVNTATSKKSVGSIVGIVLGSFAAVALVFFAKERYVDKPKRDAARRAGMPPGYPGTEMSSRRGRRNNTRDIV